MILYSESEQKYVPHQKVVTFIHSNKLVVKHVQEERVQYWVGFAARWSPETPPTIKALSLSPAQQGRLTEVENVDLRLTEAKNYVEFGLIPTVDEDDEGVSEVHSFFQGKSESEVTEGEKAKDDEEKRRALLGKLPNHRFVIETGGLENEEGVYLFTTRQSQSQVTSALNALNSGLRETLTWKSGSGWVEVGSVEFEKIAQAVFQHVQNSFVAEKNVEDEIAESSDLSTYDLAERFQHHLSIL